MSDPRYASSAPKPTSDAGQSPPSLLSDARAGEVGYPPEYRRETRPRLMSEAEVKDVLRILKALRLEEGYAMPKKTES